VEKATPANNAGDQANVGRRSCAGRLDGNVVIITGGAGGIGAACTGRFIREGALVAIADQSIERAMALASEFPRHALAIDVNVAIPDSVRTMIDRVHDKWGRIDVLLNNAAATSPDVLAADTTAPDISVDVWDQIMRINLRGAMLGCKFAIPQMVKQGRGVVLNMASVAGLGGDFTRIAYGTSKAALIMFSKYVAAQHGRDGIRCNALVPGPIRTAALEHYPELIAAYARQALTPRLGTPEDVAALAAFLASDDASYLTGQAISIDGGHFSHQPQMADMMGL
jgi:NAD(P)-dependent dehydrogenase (short-subunit alcohol dehydrogenase family)